MKSFTLLLVGVLTLSSSFSQQIDPDLDCVATPQPIVIDLDPSLIYPDCTIIQPPVIIQPWEWPQDWGWLTPSFYEIVFIPLSRNSDQPEGCFGYCESEHICFETIQTSNSFQIHLISYEDVTVQMDLSRLDDKNQSDMSYALFPCPVKFKKGYYVFEQKLNYVPDATFLLDLKVNGEKISSRIKTRTEQNVWKVDSTCIYKMNLIDNEL